MPGCGSGIAEGNWVAASPNRGRGCRPVNAAVLRLLPAVPTSLAKTRPCTLRSAFEALGERLGEPVGQRLREDRPVRVVLLLERLDVLLDAVARGDKVEITFVETGLDASGVHVLFTPTAGSGRPLHIASTTVIVDDALLRPGANDITVQVDDQNGNPIDTTGVVASDHTVLSRAARAAVKRGERPRKKTAITLAERPRRPDRELPHRNTWS